MYCLTSWLYRMRMGVAAKVAVMREVGVEWVWPAADAQFPQFKPRQRKKMLAKYAPKLTNRSPMNPGNKWNAALDKNK